MFLASLPCMTVRLLLAAVPRCCQALGPAWLSPLRRTTTMRRKAMVRPHPLRAFRAQHTGHLGHRSFWGFGHVSN